MLARRAANIESVGQRRRREARQQPAMVSYILVQTLGRLSFVAKHGKKKLIKKSERLESFLGAADFFPQRASPYLDIGKDQKSFRSLVFELYSEKKIVGGASAKNSGFYNSEILDFPQNDPSLFCGKSKISLL